ncbi:MULTISPECIES: class I SAM-dependent methyltransferase [unclassified Streptomyces]|uniref:class I SAM-dependent methyltransferase n=1 Tax=unclassified Streptomyces TaxID=2593676 RepID=UPI003D70E388
MRNDSGFQLQGNAPERYERYIAPLMRPFIDALLDAVDLSPGAHVLDLACGTGFVARAAAAQAGPTGHVAAADINPDMLKLAAAKAPRLYPDIEFTQAPADTLPYGDASFDAVLCNQGAQFFPDLSAAVAEAARVLRPGGRLALAVWAAMERCPYFAVQYEVIEEYAAPEDVVAAAGAFSCDTGSLTDAFTAAGLRNITVRQLTREVVTPVLTDWIPGQMTSVPWTRSLTAAGPETFDRACADLTTRMADYLEPDGTARLPFTALLATAER